MKKEEQRAMSKINGIELSSIRERIFRDRYTVDSQLSKIVSSTPSHKFLTNPASQIIYQFLLRYLVTVSELSLHKDKENIRVLDWGCGKGQCTYFLNKSGVNVEACDIKNNKGDSAFGQETPIIKECNIQVVPLTHEYLLPFDDNAFDVVLSMGVLEHVPDDFRSLKEIHRILRNDGLFFCFFLPQRSSWTQFIVKKTGDDYHDRLYTKAKVLKLLKSTDLEIRDFWYRQLFPKNTVEYFSQYYFEMMDQSLVKYTPLKFLTTNIEFVAQK